MAPGRAPHRHPHDTAEGLGHPPREGGDRIVRSLAAGLRPAAILQRAAELAAAEQPFALATVVAVERPTSARPGARGIVHPDGTIEGWIGGSCAQPIVVREALRSIGDGQPRLLRLSRDEPGDSRRGDGVVEYVMTCHSGGTLEIYVEPHLPTPALWVAGITPIAVALVELGHAAGYQVTLLDPVADAEAHPGADRIVTSTDLGSLDPGTAPFVIVATQGQWDEEAVEAALRREPAYVGLVASPKRAAVVRDYLRGEGLPEERLAALRAPAGLDIGAETPEEIALSILAELVQVRRGRAPFVASPGPATLAGQAVAHAPAAVGASPVAYEAAAAPRDGPAGIARGPEHGAMVLRDPVCGMTVDEDDVRHIADHEGVVYAFCCVGCRSRFVKDPAAFVAASGPVTGG